MQTRQTLPSSYGKDCRFFRIHPRCLEWTNINSFIFNILKPLKIGSADTILARCVHEYRRAYFTSSDDRHTGSAVIGTERAGW
jgi:hypothetical protein